MIFTKSNSYLSGLTNFVEYSLHDLYLTSFDYDNESRHMIANIWNPYKHCWITLQFNNIAKISYFSPDDTIITNVGELYGLEEIPNEFNADDFLERTKESYAALGEPWNENWFAVSFIFTNTTELKIICESMSFDHGDSKNIPHQ